MMTVKEVRELTGVSVRALHHYDALGLLKPTRVTEAGYRLYDDGAVERLFLILLYRELGIPLKDIRSILDAPDFDRNRVLDQQIGLLKDKVNYLQNRIHLANGIRMLGVKNMNWNQFDPAKMDEYSQQAKTLYGNTQAYQEYQRKSQHRTTQQENDLGGMLMEIFSRMGAIRDTDPAGEEAQALVRELRAFITRHYYNCTPQILRGLGQLYAGSGSMTENIDAAGGKGTGEFARQAIDIYCTHNA